MALQTSSTSSGPCVTASFTMRSRSDATLSSYWRSGIYYSSEANATGVFLRRIGHRRVRAATSTVRSWKRRSVATWHGRSISSRRIYVSLLILFLRQQTIGAEPCFGRKHLRRNCSSDCLKGRSLTTGFSDRDEHVGIANKIPVRTPHSNAFYPRQRDLDVGEDCRFRATNFENIVRVGCHCGLKDPKIRSKGAFNKFRNCYSG